MFKQWLDKSRRIFHHNFKVSQGFSLIEVGFLVMVISIVILPVVATINTNSNSDKLSVNEILERQQSIEQGMRSLMQRAINGKIIVQDIDDATADFRSIDNGSGGTLYNLSNLYSSPTPASISTGYSSPALIFKVPIGVQNNTKTLFKFKWTIKDVSTETVKDATGADVSVVATPEGLKKVDLLLQAYLPDADLTDAAVQPLVTQHGTTFYAEEPTPPTGGTTGDIGVIINLDLNKSGCSPRKLGGGSGLKIGGIFKGILGNAAEHYYKAYGLPVTYCGQNTSNEPIGGLPDWYLAEYEHRDDLDSPYSYLKKIKLGMQPMDDIDPVNIGLIDVALTANPNPFFLKLPTNAGNYGAYYNDASHLSTFSYAYSSTARAIKALTSGTYAKGAIIHVITTNLDGTNELANKSSVSDIPLSQALGVFANPDLSLLDTVTTTTTTAPTLPATLPAVNPVVMTTTDPTTFITTKISTLYSSSSTEVTTEITKTDCLLNLAKTHKSSIKHYAILHKGVSGNTSEYFNEITNQTGGKVYYISGDKSNLRKALSTIFKEIGNGKKIKKSRTYRHSMG